MLPLLLAAVLAQAADAASTCHALQHGGVELNPIHGQSCARVVALKSASTAAIILVPLPRKLRAGLAVFALANGTVGATLNLSRH